MSETLTDNERWLQFHILQAKMEIKYVPIIRKALQEQIYQFINYAHTNGWKTAADHINMAVKTYPIEHALLPLYKECAAKYGWITFVGIRNQKGFFSGNIVSQLLQKISEYFEKYILNKSVVQITEQTKKWITQQLSIGLEAGDGYEKIARSMVDSQTNVMRARRITRTETVRASNQSALDAANMSKIKLQKKWISAQDKRTRRIPRDATDHLNLHGIVIPLDEFFSEYTNEGIQLMIAPGDPNAGAASVCNCRCTLSFPPVRDARGRVILT